MSTSEVALAAATVAVVILAMVVVSVWAVRRIMRAVQCGYTDGYASGYVDGVLANPPRPPGSAAAGQVVQLHPDPSNKPSNNPA